MTITPARELITPVCVFLALFAWPPPTGGRARRFCGSHLPHTCHLRSHRGRATGDWSGSVA